MEAHPPFRALVPGICLMLFLMWGWQIKQRAVMAASGMERSTLNTSGVIIYVDADAGGSNTGSSWSNAYTTLQPALDRALAGDQIWVADGTYKPTVQVGGVGDRYRAFQMKNGMAIYGGFAGGESSLDQRDWADQLSIISGDIGLEGFSTDNCYYVINNTAELGLHNSAILDGFIITHGITVGYGGGMYNEEASPTLVNCLFTANSANYGGGITNIRSALILNNCQFVHNTVGTFGGGMYNDASSPKLTACTFSANTAVNTWV